MNIFMYSLRIFGPDGYKIPDGEHWPEAYGELNGDLQAEVGHFFESLESGEPFTMSANDAVRAVAVNDAILRSVESGQPESVTEV